MIQNGKSSQNENSVWCNLKEKTAVLFTMRFENLKKCKS